MLSASNGQNEFRGEHVDRSIVSKWLYTFEKIERLVVNPPIHASFVPHTFTQDTSCRIALEAVVGKSADERNFQFQFESKLFPPIWCGLGSSPLLCLFPVSL